ncbi:MAG: trehalase [Gammaproteobacteria bacterium]|nr:trehalase [Gammaproteobacteria bacterium]MBV8405266.1 trehalase [Gammaproteobacteria bacterium]
MSVDRVPRRILRASLLVGLLWPAAAALADSAAPDPARTRAYIDKAWSTLTRSMEDCSALTDPKVATRPVLYLPAELPPPADLKELAGRCRTDVRTLPQAIGRLGEVDAAQLPVQGLLYLPHPYIVPGGFFNEMYGWDSYFIVLGLLADQRGAMARDMVENALFEVEHYGGVLNANRTYYLSRSQPPLLSAMIAALLRDATVFPEPAARKDWLARVYPLAVRNYEIWTGPEHRAGTTGLARYQDLGSGPVLEARDSRYYQGVIRWLIAHPAEDPGYLIKGSEHPAETEATRLAGPSCDVRSSAVCAGAWAGGFRLSADYYHGDRAMRESGFDINFHFGPYGGSTHHFAAVCLNALLYRYALDLADFARELGRSADAERWADAAAARRQAIDRYLWRAESGTYADFDFLSGKPAGSAYITMFYPLWAGAASPEQAAAVRGQLPVFERTGGLAMDDRASGAQWDYPFGWAPTNWLAVCGLSSYGFREDVERLATKFTGTIDRSYAVDGTIREKYNMALGNADVRITAGYTQNVVGFGWSNGVYLKMRQLLSADAGSRPCAQVERAGLAWAGLP